MSITNPVIVRNVELEVDRLLQELVEERCMHTSEEDFSHELNWNFSINVNQRPNMSRFFL